MRVGDAEHADRERVDWEPEREHELVETLHQLVRQVDPSSSGLDGELERLESSYGAAVYSELIFLLCHLRFSGPEAKISWQRIVAHREDLEQRLASFVDLRVALASYFLQVDRRLENPKLIELKLFEETEASAYRDELTGLYNYRFFSEFLRCEVIRGARTHAPLSLVMIDVDDFKPYNDHGGHETGNVALREIAQLLTRTLHPSDMAARYGGEEFALILPSTPKQGAAVVAERIRARIEEHGFPDQDMQPEGTLTVSMGVATSPGDAGETGELIRCADQALYSAKADGKNRVQLFGQSLRSYQRVKVDIEGSYRLIGSERVPLCCVDLGQGGLCFVATREIEPRALTQVTLDLPGSKRHISLTCEVVDVTPVEFGRFLVGSRILNMDANDRRRLCAYISEAGSLSNEAPAK